VSDEPSTLRNARHRLARALTDAAGRPGGPPPVIDTGPADPAEQSDRSAGAAPGGGLARLAGSAFDPGRPGLRALLAVAVVVLLGAAVLAWWSRPRPEPVVPQLAVTAGGGLASPTSPAELVVAVSGKVHQPGLVELPPGARVADAIEAAGGLLPGADVAHLNLARKVVDGELIAVGIPPPPGAAAGGPGGAGAGPATGAKLNLNTATLAELETLPGIGPALAQRIIDHRTSHGPFGSVEELREVAGIGEVRFAELADLVTV